MIFIFERRRRRLLADNAEASEHVSSTPDSQAMTRCPLAILKNYGSSGKLVPSVSAGQSVHGFDGLNGFSPIE